MTWQTQLQRAYAQPQQLTRRLKLPESSQTASDKTLQQFRMLAPESFVARIKMAASADPLLRQIWPSPEEDRVAGGFVNDPVGDLASQVAPGLLHKYHGRVLLVVTGACPIHCRYCFRRHYPYANNSISPAHLEQALHYITEHRDIIEVILSGGDPLMLSDEKLFDLVQELQRIPHLKRLRIHSRMPIVLPKRILDGKFGWLQDTGLKTTMVVHCNHANELQDAVKQAANRLREYGVHLLNQSVLLRGVNDQADTLIALSERLFDYDIQPYYLHLLDPVQGAAHFSVPKQTAIELMQQIRQRLPGYLVPKLVQEIHGEPSKIQLEY